MIARAPFRLLLAVVVLLGLLPVRLWSEPPTPWSKVTDPQELYAGATQAALDGRSRDAIHWLERLLSLHPEHVRVPDALYALGHAAEEAGDRGWAIATWRRLAAQFPTYARRGDALKRVAQAYLALASAQENASVEQKKRLEAAADAELLRTAVTGDATQQERTRKSVHERWQALAVPGERLVQQYRQQALAVCQELVATLPDSEAAVFAGHTLASYEGRRLDFSIGHPFRSDESLRIPFQHEGMMDVVVHLYRFDADSIVEKAKRQGTADLRKLVSLSDVRAGETPVVERRLHLWSSRAAVGPVPEGSEDDVVTDEPWISAAESGMIDLGKQPAGLYLLVASESYFRASVPVLVSDLALTRVAAGGETAVFAADATTGTPVPAAVAWIFGPRGTPAGSPAAPDARQLDLNEEGMARLAWSDPDPPVLARWGDHFASTEGTYRWSGSRSAASAVRTFVCTDRPIYRPGQRVQYRAILRALENGELLLPPARAISIRLRDAHGNVVKSEEKTPDVFGCVAGAFDLAADGDSGTFHIETEDGGSTRVRVEAYRLPAFELELKPLRDPLVQGDPVTLDLAGRYFFGRPVVQAEVRAEFRRRVAWQVHPALRSTRLVPRSPNRLDLPRGGQRTSTGADGHAVLDLGREPVGVDVQEDVSVVVRDRSRREVMQYLSVPVYAGSVTMALEADGSPESGKAFSFAARAVRLDGSPAPAVPIEVQVARVTWEENRSEREIVTPVTTVQGATGADGVAVFSVPAQAEGLLRLRAEGADPEGRKISYTGDLYVGGWRRSESRPVDLAVRVDAQDVEAGQEIGVVVDSTLAAGSAWLVVGSDRLQHVRRVELGFGKTRIHLPVEAAWFPGTTVQVALVRDGKFHQNEAELRFSRRPRTLNVSLTLDREVYAVRDKAICHVRVTDAEGRPVQAQVALAAVDEAIYAMAEDRLEAIIEHFHRPLPSVLRWLDGFEFAPTTSVDYVLGVGGGGGGRFGGRMGGRRNLVARGGGGMASEHQLRSDFSETMYWNAAIVTGPDGTATVEIPTIDAITAYRLGARAVTVATQVGFASGRLRVDREFFVQLAAPRHFVPGDQSVVSTVVFDRREGGAPVTVALEVEGAVLDGAARRELSAAEARSGRVDWRITVAEARAVVLRCVATSAGREDGIEITVPVVPFGPSRDRGLAGRCTGDISEKVMLDRNDRLRSRALQISVTAGRSGAVLDALEFLAGYPYGCIEQTMSRFVPSLACQRALQSSRRPTPKQLAELPAMVNRGMQRIYALQHHDGSWGWWHGDASSALITAYVLRGLRAAQSWGVAVDPRAIDKARIWLSGAIEKETDPLVLATVAAALAGPDLGSQAVVDRAWAARAALPEIGSALLVQALVAAGRMEQAAAEAASLRDRRQPGGEFANWRARGSRTSWFDSDIEVTAECVRALIAVEPKDEIAARGFQFLMNAKHGGRWGSTRATAAVVLALADYIALSPDADAGAPCKVTWNGTVLHDGPLGSDQDTVVKLPISDAQLRDGSNDLRITSSSTQALWFDLHWLEEERATEFIERSSGGVDVRRTYHRIGTDQDASVAQTAALEPGAVVASGDEIEVCLRIDSVRDYQYLVLEDPKPAGFEFAAEDSHPTGYFDPRDDRVSVVFSRLPEGITEIRYRLRAETPGVFRVGPAGLTHMYSERLFSLSSSTSLKVE